MADKDLDSGDGPSLEMPSLGSLFRRKKKGGAEPEPVVDDTPPADEGEEATAVGDAADGTATPAADPTAEAADEAANEAAADDPTTILDEPATDEPGADELAADELDGDRASTGQVSTDEAPPLFADEVEDTSVLSDDGGLVDDGEDVDDESFDDEDDDDVEEAAGKSGGFALPPVAGRVAAIITGAIIGLLAVGLTYLAMRGCEAARGTSTCGGPGLALMIAILILLVVIGSALLGAWKVTDPSSTSFLAVGLLAVVALLFLIEVIFSPWMIVVIPLVAVGTFTLSQWVTEKFIEDADA